MKIIENKGLLFNAPDPARIVQGVEKCAQLPDGSLIAHWNMQTAMALVQMGIKDVPSPIAKSYAYPGRDPAMDHQKTMAEFVTLRKRCFNFSDMGTGKSRASLWAADYLMSAGLVKRVLILAPLSILRTAWESDLMATCMHRSYGISVGDAKRRAKVIESGCEFVIANHDCVKSSRLELVRQKFDLIIVDEATAFTNSTTDRWKALNSLLRPDIRLWLLTGTPAANSPLQAYGLAKLVNVDNVPKYYSGWRDKVMFKVSTFTYLPKETAKGDVFDALQPAIRFDKKECVQLPPVTFVEREIEMDANQAKYYAQIKTQMLAFVAGKQITAVNSGILLGKLLQVAAGAVYSDDGSIIDFRASTRMNEMLQVIHECENKVLVFANYKHSIRMIAGFLEKHNIECAVIDGDTPDGVREMHIKNFQTTGMLKVLILQPKVAAHGITLTEASVTIWFSPTSSVETWRQANARMDRIGQKNKMTVVKLIGSPVERKVYNVLEKRDADQSELLNLYAEELRT